MRWTHIDEHLVGDIVIVDLRDPQILQTDPERRLVERMRRLLSNGQTKIVINLHGLHYVDTMAWDRSLKLTTVPAKPKAQF